MSVSYTHLDVYKRQFLCLKSPYGTLKTIQCELVEANFCLNKKTLQSHQFLPSRGVKSSQIHHIFNGLFPCHIVYHHLKKRGKHSTDENVFQLRIDFLYAMSETCLLYTSMGINRFATGRLVFEIMMDVNGIKICSVDLTPTELLTLKGTSALEIENYTH